MIFWIFIVIAMVAIDQLSKLWVVSTFAHVGDSISIIGNFLRFTYVRNPGAAFGLAGDVGFAHIFFIAVFIVAIVIFGYMFVKNDFHDRKRFFYSLGITLLIAGSIGNTIDRIFQPDNRVVDFIAFPTIWEPVFNVADMCLTVGITLFLIDQFLIEPKRKRSHES